MVRGLFNSAPCYAMPGFKLFARIMLAYLNGNTNFDGDGCYCGNNSWHRHASLRYGLPGGWFADDNKDIAHAELTSP